MININCCDPVLIVNPQLYECALKSDVIVVDGKPRDITTSQKYDIMNGEKVSTVLNIPYAKSLSQEYLNQFSRYDQEKMLQRLENFVESSYLLDSKNGEAFHLYQFVPCGKCAACNASLMHSYIQRCQFQMEQDKLPSYFVTLTYNDEHLPLANDENNTPVVNRRHVTLFLKRLTRILGTPIKYFVVSEYGKLNKRPHYHLLLFGIPQMLGPTPTRQDYLVNKYVQYCWREPERHKHKIGFVTFDEYVKQYPKFNNFPADYDKRSFGFTNVSICENASSAVAYCTKYLYKDFDEVTDKETFKSISCNMGLDFAKFISDQPVVNGKFSYRPMDSLSYEEVSLCGYYLKKLYPSLSQLIPVDIRRACSFLNQSFWDLKSQDISKSYKESLSFAYYNLKHRYQFLMDFNDNPPIVVKTNLRKFLHPIPESVKLNNFELSSEVFDKCVHILEDYTFDYEELLEKLKKRSQLFDGFAPRSREQIFAAASKFSKDMKVQTSKSTL